MGMGSSFTGGYNAARADNQSRSFMPAINTLSGMIRNARSRIPRTGGSSIAFAGDTGSASDVRARERQERHDRERAEEEAQAEKVMQQQEADRQQQEKEAIVQEENVRRQEKHEEDLRLSQESSDIKEREAGRGDEVAGKQEAYEQAKHGLMMGDKQMVQDAMRKLMPGAQSDQITYGETEEGVKKVTARPGQQDVPDFIFHPDGYVGVQLPGRTKPVVFENAEEAFKTILAPMNPQRYQKKGGATEKDLVTERKNVRTADYQERKLRADIHADAHEAAMQQFERDGYYQAATYDEDAYWKTYKDFVGQATGLEARGPESGTKGGKQGTPEQYRGDEAPQGFPGARRGPKGGWYIQKKGKWFPVLEGKEQGPGSAAPPKKARPPGRRPKRSPMPTADEQMPDVQAAGINLGGKGKVYRGKKQPPDYPDAQYDEGQKAWFYFDEENGWQKVKV